MTSYRYKLVAHHHYVIQVFSVIQQSRHHFGIESSITSFQKETKFEEKFPEQKTLKKNSQSVLITFLGLLAAVCTLVNVDNKAFSKRKNVSLIKVI